MIGNFGKKSRKLIENDINNNWKYWEEKGKVDLKKKKTVYCQLFCTVDTYCMSRIYNYFYSSSEVNKKNSKVRGNVLQQAGSIIYCYFIL
jgi:hypothetical protein